MVERTVSSTVTKAVEPTVSSAPPVLIDARAATKALNISLTKKRASEEHARGTCIRPRSSKVEVPRISASASPHSAPKAAIPLSASRREKARISP
jgi:hypothetical protein